MPLLDLLRQTDATPKHREISCPKYEPQPGSRRCLHYLPNGACSRPDEFMCIEWLAVNAGVELRPAADGGGH